MGLRVRYCAGWDWEHRRQVGWLSEADARAADRAGRPYTALLLRGDDPVAAIDVAWQDSYLSVCLLDSVGGRASRTEYRRLRGGELFALTAEEWREDEDGAFHRRAERDPDGLERTRDSRGRGGVVRGDPGGWWTPVPEFGRWGQLVPGAGADPCPVAEPPDGTVGDAERPWRAPRPMMPSHLDALVSDGGTVVDRSTGDPTAVRLKEGPSVDLRSGRLVACDPTRLSEPNPPFTAAVPPGRYPVVFAEAPVGPNHGYGAMTAAAILRITDAPVHGWEMALTEGQDTRLLADGGYYGFGVDSGAGCFVDADHAPAIAGYFEGRGGEDDSVDEADDVEGHDYAELADDGHRFELRETGENLVWFDSGHGDGAYATWIGRDGDGGVACFVVDLQVVR